MVVDAEARHPEDVLVEVEAAAHRHARGAGARAAASRPSARACPRGARRAPAAERRGWRWRRASGNPMSHVRSVTALGGRRAAAAASAPGHMRTMKSASRPGHRGDRAAHVPAVALGHERRDERGADDGGGAVGEAGGDGDRHGGRDHDAELRRPEGQRARRALRGYGFRRSSGLLSTLRATTPALAAERR